MVCFVLGISIVPVADWYSIMLLIIIIIIREYIAY